MIHVTPINDAEDHDLSNNGNTCKCNPQVLTEGELIVIHNSFDGREGVEWANEIIKQ